jgi:hypothetical protein
VPGSYVFRAYSKTSVRARFLGSLERSWLKLNLSRGKSSAGIMY